MDYNSECEGFVCEKTKTIWVVKGMKRARTIKTWLHEIGHVMFPYLAEEEIEAYERDMPRAIAAILRMVHNEEDTETQS